MGTSSTEAIIVSEPEKIPTYLTIRITSTYPYVNGLTEITLGTSITIRGNLVNAMNDARIQGRTVKVHAISPEGTDITVGTYTTDAQGVYSHVSTPSITGLWQYYAEFEGDVQYEGC